LNWLKELAKFCAESQYKNFPEEVIDKVKYFLLDFIGVAARGSIAESTRIIFDFIRFIGGNPKSCSIIGAKMRASPQYAALANGMSAHTIEMDDVNNEASLHPGVANFPAALAIGEFNKAEGRKFIEGIVLGYEVTIRLGKALGPALHYRRGFHPTATCGAFGATIGAGKILGLNEDQITNALGIVGGMASGSMECLTGNSWLKKFQPGWASHNGVIAAFLAQKGFKGSPTIIEGEHGFLHMGSDSPRLDKILEGIGESYEILKTSIKPHACCRYKQGPIDAILKIMRENDIKPNQIQRVTLGILKAGIPFVVKPEEVKYNPKSLIEAQFSMPFGAAIAILYGRADLEMYVLEKWNSIEVRKMMERVFCIENPELEEDYPRKWPATAEITTKDGRSYFTRVDYPKGDPENPISWSELIEKFQYLTEKVYSKDRRNKILNKIKNLEKEIDISKFTSLY
jgi:2-methylcitrate dehydratase PrpD